MTEDTELNARLPCGCCGAIQPLSAYANDPGGMMITFADHLVAVAKAVEAERERLLQWCDQIMGSVEGCIDLNAAEENAARIWTDNFAAAIRSRGVGK